MLKKNLITFYIVITDPDLTIYPCSPRSIWNGAGVQGALHEQRFSQHEANHRREACIDRMEYHG